MRTGIGLLLRTWLSQTGLASLFPGKAIALEVPRPRDSILSTIPMDLNSAIDLKKRLLDCLITPLSARGGGGRASQRFASRSALTPAMKRKSLVIPGSARDFGASSSLHSSIALGIAPADDKGRNYRLAIRVQRADLMSSALVEALKEDARGEAEVRYIGRVVTLTASKRMTPVPRQGSTGHWFQSLCRPLIIGASVGHFDGTAGTLGCFVHGEDKEVCLLSNNHVLAKGDAGAKGDATLQPGRMDGGQNPESTVGALYRWVQLNRSTPNLVDAALSLLGEQVDFDHRTLAGINGSNRVLAGVRTATGLDEGMTVHKVGRTTGATSGRVTAFGLDHVIVGGYGMGNLRFDGQIEIEGAGAAPFSDGGDSGSLIVDNEYRAVALLFAGGEKGENGPGLTYANPINVVLANLNVSLLY